MGAGLSFPEVFVGVSSADPGDPNTVDVWSDLALRTWRIRQAQSGKQYELGQNPPGRMNAHFRNVDEYLNPANTTSPLYPYAKPFRQIRFMGSYPNGSTGNMWNSQNGRDTTFESYGAGTLPSWLTAVGGTGPAVQVANPHGGSKSLQYTVAGTAVPQGVATVPAETLPGRTYTAYGFVRQSSASTQQIAVGGLTAADRYNRTGNLGGSTADQGGTWTVSGGVVGDYTTIAAVVPQVLGTAAISNGSVNVSRHATLGVTAQDYDLRCWLSVPAIAAGATIVAGLVGSFTDANNHYRYQLVFNTNGTVDAQIQKIVAGTVTTLQTTTSVAGYVAGSKFWLRAQKTGNTLNLKAWSYGLVEPTGWTVTTTDAALTGAAALGMRCQLTTGNTNTTPAITFGPLAVTGYTTPGQTTTTTGAYVQLAVTFVATQPTHYIQWTTVGTAVAGTVNLDDLQCNPGGTAQAFTSTGPLCRGIWGGHVERLPITWVPGTNGYEGQVDAPCVGDFAALARIGIHTDLTTAILALGPAAYYPLWESSGATSFADISGNGNPPLQRLDSPAGASSPPPAPGTPNGVAGDPGGVGVAFTMGVPGSTPSDVGSMIGTGPAFRTPGVNFPSTANGNNIGVSLVVVVNASASYPMPNYIDVAIARASTFLPNSSAQYCACALRTQFDGSIFGTFFTPALAGNPAAIVLPQTPTNVMNDNKTHLVVLTFSQVVGGNTVGTIYVDGVSRGTDTQLTSTIGVFNQVARNVMVGGFTDGVNVIKEAGGTIDHVAFFERALTAAEITTLYNAYAGNIGETSGARVQRYLNSYHPGPAVIDLASMSTMGAPAATEGTKLLPALQFIQDTEAGNLFENRDGLTQLDGREIRYLRTTSTVTFGENVGAGQIPYTEKGGGPPVFDYDLTQMYNQATVTRTGGIRAVANPDTTGSQSSFYAQPFTLTVGCQTDAEAIDHANSIVANFQQPKLRVRTLTVDLGAIPTLFPQIMNLEKGQRVTAVRVAKAGNAGAGVTISNDYFLENINHRDIDPETGSWLVDLQMSPAPLQPWILGDATYGQLGITTVLGF